MDSVTPSVQPSLVLSRARIWFRNVLLVSGWALIISAIAFPVAQMWFLPAGSYFGIILQFIIVGIVNLVCAFLAWGISAMSEKGVFREVVRILLGGIPVTILLYNFAMWVGLMWTIWIAPRAEIIMPDGFTGTAEIRVIRPLKPSLATAGKTYRYEVPSSGLLVQETGWIGSPKISFPFEKGFSRSGSGYQVFIHWSNGKPLRWDEFTFDFNRSKSQSIPDSLYINIVKP
jgi:hypothetical protein